MQLSIRCLLVGIAFSVFLPMVTAASVTDQWKSAVSGDWTNAANWSGNGQYPNNDANNAYLAVVAATGSPYTVTLNSAGTISVNQLNVTAPNATFNLASGTLVTANGINFSAGTVNLNGGTLSGATVTFGNNVTTNVNSLIGVYANLVNNGTTNINAGNELYLRFASFYNNGYLRMTDNNIRSRYPLFATSGTEALVNAGTAVFDSNASFNTFFPINNNSGTLLVNSGTAEFANGDLRFTGNSFVGGAGTFEYYRPSYLAGSRIYNSGTLTMSSARTNLYGDVFNYGNMIFTGAVGFQQGSLSGGGSYNLTATSSGTIGNLDNLYEHDLGATLNNAGTLALQAGHYLLLNNGTLSNSGTFNLGSAGTLITSLYDYDATTVDRFTNSGTIAVGGYSNFGVPLYNSGTISINTGATFSLIEAGTFTANSLITGAGTASVFQTAVFVPSGTLTLSAAYTTVQSASLNTSGVVRINGRLDLASAALGGSGSYAIGSTGSVSIGSGSESLSAQLFNDGTINVNGVAQLTGGGTLNNAGYLNFPQGGIATVSLGKLYNTGTFTNYQTETLQLNTPVVFAGNTLLANDGTIFLNSGAEFDAGTLGSNVGQIYSKGTFSTAASPNVRQLSCYLFNNGTMTIAPGGTLSFYNGTLQNNGTLLLNDRSTGTFTPMSRITGVMNIRNYGTIAVGNPTGAVSVAPLSNYGTFIANSGSVLLQPLYAESVGQIDSGTFIIANGASLSFSPASAITSNSGAITFQGPNATFSSIDALTNNGGTLTLLNGKQYSAAQAVTNRGTLRTDAASTFSFSSTLSNFGSIYGNVALAGAATLNSNSYTQYLDGAGSATVAASATATADHLRLRALALLGGSRLDVTAGGGTLGTSVISSYAGSSATLNLNDHDLIFNYSTLSPLTSLTNLIKSGFDGGQWDGIGITSATAAANPNRALGIAEASATLGTAGGTFSGQSVDGTSVLIKYTYSGDANLDGRVDVLDLGLLASHWQQAGSWNQGDFNYDGKIDVVDLGRLASDWQLGAIGPAQSFVDALAQFDLDAAVPEPSSLAALSLAAAGFARKRTARQTRRWLRTSASALRASGRSAA